MAKKKKKSKKKKKETTLGEHTRKTIWVIVSVGLGVFFILASMKKGGVVGDTLYSFFDRLLGLGYYLLPLLALVFTIALLIPREKEVAGLQVASGGIFLLSALGLLELLTSTQTAGLLGSVIISPLGKLFGAFGTAVFLVSLIAISLVIIFEAHVTIESFKVWSQLKQLFTKKEVETEPRIISGDDGNAEGLEEEKEEADEGTEKRGMKLRGMFGKDKKEEGGKDVSSDISISGHIPNDKEYIPPPLSLLQTDSGKPGHGDIKANANLIKRTLRNFGIDVEMDEISIGPTVTRYALKPAEGVRLSKITNLQNNLELALAAHPVRIEAPIPGKALVGIEVPNSAKTTVGLAGLLSSEDFQQSSKPLLVALGKGISGTSYFADIGKMPHLLIAGATGAGKSVTLHALITSLLYRNSPESLKFIMVDPKRVELTLYNGIPHLLTPVITQAKKTILALKWAAREMDRRYDVLEHEKVRDIASYHKNVLPKKIKRYKKAKKKGDEDVRTPDKMPYIVIIIDELADIMQAYPRELESAIVRLAQMSRAVGIHLLISTQRPSVNVITGLIKANIPARLALQVSSQVDSRTILDGVGAEKLLGAGDMLYQGADMSKPTRIQSAFISEKEVKSVVNHLKEQYEDELPEKVDIKTIQEQKASVFDAALEEEEEEEERDELYEDALELVVNAGKASTSYLQRKLRIGYARAARIMDTLEENGVISEKDGSKPRDVLVSKEQVVGTIDEGGEDEPSEGDTPPPPLYQQ